MLEQVNDVHGLYDRIGIIMRTGAVTNGVPERENLEREIEAGTLWLETFEEGIFILRRRDGFQRMNYLITRNAHLPEWRSTHPTVMEIPFRVNDPTFTSREEEWIGYGFTRILSRVHLTRAGCVSAGMGETEVPFASHNDLDSANELLERCFDPRTGCLPTREELVQAIEEKRILYFGSGILHWRYSARGTEIRHLASAPEERRKGIAHRLLGAFLALEGHNISKVWTTEQGKAKTIYEKYGFVEDGWRSHVLIRPEGEGSI